MAMSDKVKLSDYVARFLAEQGVDTVFALSGGASLHLIHSVEAHPDLQLVCPLHEQAAAAAADGYSRLSGRFGVAVTTSGPGATNLITGICCSYYDSVPTLFITGQVSTFRMVGDTGVRQIGFQETPTVSLVSPVTKYAVTITDPSRIRFELEKAVFMMHSGRPGPALVDIPDNLQREMIEPGSLEGFRPPVPPTRRFFSAAARKSTVLSLLAAAERPVIVAGWGVALSGLQAQFRAFARATGIPVALTWGAADLLADDDPLNVGRFGTHGARHANFAVQNSDLVLSLGSRLDTKSTGSPVNTFARAAKKIVLDIDANELGKFAKFGLETDLLIEDDLRIFFDLFSEAELEATVGMREPWLAKIAHWKASLGEFDRNLRAQFSGLNPYDFVTQLSRLAPADATVVVDTGCAIAWVMQSWEVRSGQRVLHDCNNTAMGWSLGAALGCHFAEPERPLLVIIGDGSIMMTLQELASIRKHGIPVKIFLLNNSGYAMIQQTQDQWLGSRYVASSVAGGLGFPDFGQIAQAFGYKYVEICERTDVSEILRSNLGSDDPVLFEVVIPPSARVVPQVKFGRPNEDMEPLLPRDMFSAQMLIDR
jgi:acetolactate synthase-1/2/3 large subunit